MRLFLVETDNEELNEWRETATFVILAHDETEARATLATSHRTGSWWPINFVSELTPGIVLWDNMPEVATVLY